VKSSLKNLEYSFDYSFEAGIEYRSAGESKKTTFVVHHSIRPDLMDSDLRDWAQGQKLIPWVAVAAQLPVSRFPGKIWRVYG
jgi:sacsin